MKKLFELFNLVKSLFTNSSISEKITDIVKIEEIVKEEITELNKVEEIVKEEEVKPVVVTSIEPEIEKKIKKRGPYKKNK